MADKRKTITLGLAVAIAVLATVVNTAWVAVLLFVLAALLIAWGLQPKRTEACRAFALRQLRRQGTG
jgi:Flp pilus assembly protein TadB